MSTGREESRTRRDANSLSDSHSSSNGDVETGELLVLIEDCNVTEIVAVDIDIVGRGNSDSNLELSGLLKRTVAKLAYIRVLTARPETTYQVVFTVKGFYVANGFSNNLLLVEPNLSVSRSLRLETVRKLLSEKVYLVVKLTEGRVGRAHLERIQ